MKTSEIKEEMRKMQERATALNQMADTLSDLSICQRDDEHTFEIHSLESDFRKVDNILIACSHCKATISLDVDSPWILDLPSHGDYQGKEVGEVWDEYGDDVPTPSRNEENAPVQEPVQEPPVISEKKGFGSIQGNQQGSGAYRVSYGGGD